MGREPAFKSLETHPWYGEQIKKLHPKERAFVLDFIEKNEKLSFDEFTQRINLLGKGGLTDGILRMIEILSVVNSIGHKNVK